MAAMMAHFYEKQFEAGRKDPKKSEHENIAY